MNHSSHHFDQNIEIVIIACYMQYMYIRGGQTCSMYEPHIIKPKLQKEPQHKNIKTRIYLQSTLL